MIAALPGCGSSSSPSANLPPPIIPPTREVPPSAPPIERRPRIPATEPVIRVRVVEARPAQGVILVSAPVEAKPWLRVKPVTSASRGVVLRAPVRVALGSRTWSIVDADGVSAAVYGQEPVEIVPADEENARELRINDRVYPGFFRVIARTDVDPAAFDVVSHVPLEAYLPGVLARELFNNWKLQTHAAQAIAARSFACCEHAFWLSRRHFDVNATQASQAYVGRVTHKTSLDATAITRGQVLTFDNFMVPGYYSSCCGGTAARAVDAIGPGPTNDIAPLHGRAEPDVCTNSPLYRWRVERPSSTLSQHLRAWAIEQNHKPLLSLSALTAIDIIARNDFARPTRLALTDVSNNRIEISAEDFRRAANYPVGSSPARNQTLWSSHFEAVVGAKTTFAGQGYGHGAGMCQYGAEALALQGERHLQILAWYYPQSTVTQAWT